MGENAAGIRNGVNFMHLKIKDLVAYRLRFAVKKCHLMKHLAMLMLEITLITLLSPIPVFGILEKRECQG